MGYQHIPNMYRPEGQLVLLFKEVYAMEKIHGTSAHVSWKDGQVHFHAGGESHVNFVKLFDVDALTVQFRDMGYDSVVIHGEAYGGKQQKQSWRYGTVLKFIAFDVKINDTWLAVDKSHKVAERLGLEFVHYVRCPTDIQRLDCERDATSEQARRNGIEGFQPREGIVVRPIIEVTTNDGSRIVCKHKRPEERETKTNRDVADPSKLAVLEAADDIANEWVTTTRLEHVLDKMGEVGLEQTRDVIVAMVEDVVREGKGELVDSKDARKAIGKKTAELFRKRFQDSLHQE